MILIPAFMKLLSWHNRCENYVIDLMNIELMHCPIGLPNIGSHFTSVNLSFAVHLFRLMNWLLFVRKWKK